MPPCAAATCTPGTAADDFAPLFAKLDGLGGHTQPAWLTPAVRAQYRDVWSRGLDGALNWYRNFERNWQRTEALADRQIAQPALFLLGDKDPDGTLEAYTLKQMPKRVPQLEQHVLKECGHWIQNEQAERVNQLLLDFLGRQYPA